MSNEEAEKGWLAGLGARLAGTDLTRIIGGEAVASIGRLIGARVDILAPGTREKARNMRDESEAVTMFTRKVAEAAAEKAVRDPELVDRAMTYLAGKTFREQNNREEVAKVAVEQLVSIPVTEEARQPDEEWMSRFEEQASKASSEQMRSLFGRVLAGEIRKPGTMSLATVHFMSLLDQRAAQTFMKLCPLMLDQGALVQMMVDAETTIQEATYLESLGFLTLPTFLSIGIGCENDGWYYFKLQRVAYRVRLGESINSDAGMLTQEGLQVLVYQFTKSGLELASIVEYDPYSKVFADALRSIGFVDVEVGEIEPTADGYLARNMRPI